MLLLTLALACSTPHDRLVVLGMDGLERKLVRRMIDQGDLPNMARMIDEGSENPVALPWPILSPILWSTMASGYTGQVHGIGGWVTPEGRTYTAADVRVMRLWDVASRLHVPTLVGGWMMSWPISPIEGQMVSDRFVLSFPMNKDPRDPSVAISEASHDDVVDTVYPTALRARVAGWVPSAAQLADTPIGYQLEAYGGVFHPAYRDETQVRVFEHLWGSSQARVGMFYLVGPDQVSHLYWPFVEPDATRLMRHDPTLRMRAAADDRARHRGKRTPPWSDAPITPEQIAEGARWVPDEYRYMDQLLGRVMGHIDPAHTTLIVVSDHGFELAQANPTLNGSHRQQATFMAWGAHVRPGAVDDSVHINDLGPTLYALAGLPAARDMPGHVLTSLFEVQPVEPVDTWVLPRVVVEPGARSDDPGTQHLMNQLEALGYIDDMGAPILGASRKQGRSDH